VIVGRTIAAVHVHENATVYVISNRDRAGRPHSARDRRILVEDG